jgi:hypothetical protein
MQNRIHFAAGRGTVYITALVAGLAASTMTGCSIGGTTTQNNEFAKYRSPAQNTTEQKAAMADAWIDETQTVGTETPESFVTDAQRVQLPQRHLSEAWDSSAETQARRAAAQSQAVTAAADASAAFSAADARQQQAFSQRDISQAEAERLEQVYAAKIAEESIRTAAQQNAFVAEADRQDEILDAAVKEWRSDVEKMRAEADAEWGRAQAEYERMLAERDAVELRGGAQIDQMKTVAERTSERASAKVRALRAEADSIAEQTDARSGELAQSIRTTEQEARARAAQLREQMKAARVDGEARAAELRARAVALEEQDVDETFSLSMTAAEARFAQTKAEADRLFEEAGSLEETLQAEISRRISTSGKLFEIDQTDYQEAIGAIDAFVEHGKGEVAIQRVKADRIERDARAEFIKAEAAARAGAVNETTRHQNTLAEEEAKRLRAEAQAEAARIRAEHLAMLAEQRKRGEVTLPGKTQPVAPGARSTDANPEFSKAPKTAERLDPKHVASFKGAIAEAQRIRMQADADERALFADAEQRRTSFGAWWEQRKAAHEASVAETNVYQRQTRAQIEQFVVEAESLLKNATAELGNAKMHAEAQRREALAMITNLRAEADAIDKKSRAMVTQLTAQAEAAERNGQSELRSLEVVKTSTKKRGEAMAAKLVAEADALEMSQQAVVAQMREEIKAAQKVLASEIVKLEQAAQSYLAVAEATYNEDLSEVAMMERVHEANAEEFAAVNDARRRMHEADIAYMRNVNSANQLMAQAAVQRVMADAEMRLDVAQSKDTVARASIIRDHAIATATVDEQFTVADAEDRATRAIFESRISSTLADRNRSYADIYLENQQANARREQAIAAAAAYRELSNRAIAMLNEQNSAFNTAAQENWYSELALPEALPVPAGVRAQGQEADALFQTRTIANTNVRRYDIQD